MFSFFASNPLHAANRRKILSMKFALISTDDVHPARTSYVLGLAPAGNDDYFVA